MLISAISALALILATASHSLQASTDNDAPRPVSEGTETPSNAGIQPVKQTLEPAPIRTVKTPPIDAAAYTDQDTPQTTPLDREPAAPEPLQTETGLVTDSQTADTQDTVSEALIPSGPTPVAQADWPGLLDQASTALTKARTAMGQFVQTNPDGSVMTGSFALRRPGRVRFDYDDPVPVLIVSDGATVAMYDHELETVDRIPISATPLQLILSRKLEISEDIEIIDIRRADTQIGIEVRDASGEMEGQLTLIFNADDFALQGWLAMDSMGETTWVSLEQVRTNMRTDPGLFRLDEPEDEEDER